MIQSVEQTVEEFRRTMEKVRAETDTPAKARAFLRRMGMLGKPQKSSKGTKPATRDR